MKNTLNKSISKFLLSLVVLVSILNLNITKAQEEIKEKINDDTLMMQMMDDDDGYYKNNSHFKMKNNFRDFGRNKDIFLENIFLSPALLVIGGIISLLLLAFWVWMFVHAVINDIESKPVWILVLWFMSIFGAAIYFFAVWKKICKKNCCGGKSFGEKGCCGKCKVEEMPEGHK